MGKIVFLKIVFYFKIENATLFLIFKILLKVFCESIFKIVFKVSLAESHLREGPSCGLRVTS